MRSSHVAFFDLLGWHLTPNAIDHKRWRLASWGHGDEATAMAARAAYNGINWPVFENAAKKNVNLTVFSRIGQGAGPQADIR